MNRKSWLLLLLLTSLSCAALAHHGRGPYSTETVTIEGATVKGWLFVNPHTQLQFTTEADDGTEVEWLAEGGSPNQLARAGIKPTLVSPGDTISVTGFPHREMPHHLLLQSIVLPNGEPVKFR